MNAGLADAANLGWLLAARLNGWGAAGILDAYERERQPITEQVSHFAMDHAHAMAKQRRGVPPEIEDESPAGDGGARGGRAGGLRSQCPAILRRRAELRLLLRRFADHRLRRRAAPALLDGRISRPPPCPAAARRISGWRTGGRSTTRSARNTPCCASIPTVAVDGLLRRRRRARRPAPAPRCRRGRGRMPPTTPSSSSRGPISTSPGGAMPSPRMRSP